MEIEEDIVGKQIFIFCQTSSASLEVLFQQVFNCCGKDDTDSICKHEGGNKLSFSDILSVQQVYICCGQEEANFIC